MFKHVFSSEIKRDDLGPTLFFVALNWSRIFLDLNLSNKL